MLVKGGPGCNYVMSVTIWWSQTLETIKMVNQLLNLYTIALSSNWYVHNVIKLFMMTSSNGKIFHVTGPLCGEFTGPSEFPTLRRVRRSFDVFFDLRLNKRLSKQPWGWWFETPSWSLWHQCNVVMTTYSAISDDEVVKLTFYCFQCMVIDKESISLISKQTRM